MKEKIKKLLLAQKGKFIAYWTIPVWFVVLYETGVCNKGIHAGNIQLEYILQSAGILLTIGLIPFALRIFNFNLVKGIREYPLEERWLVTIYGVTSVYAYWPFLPYLISRSTI